MRSIRSSLRALARRAATMTLRAAGRVEAALRRDSEPLPPLHLRMEYYGTASPRRFRAAAEGARAELVSRGLHDEAKSEAAVAYEESFVQDLLARHGLQMSDVRRGQWWNGLTHDQDVLTLRRPADRR